MSAESRLVVAVASALGKPVYDAEIEIAAGDERRAWARTDACGRATADGLTPGSYTLTVSPPPLAAQRVERRSVYLEPGRNAVTLMLRGTTWPLAEDAP
jgi:hypothetical protein